MPFIKINCPKGSLTEDQKARLAPLLVDALIREEIDPVTDFGRGATGLFFNELEVYNCFPGGVSLTKTPEKNFWIVEAFVAETFFSQPRRNRMQKAVAKAFVDVLGDDGSTLVRGDIKISPAWLMRLHLVLVEIPEGSWGAGGQTIETEEIAMLLGATEGPENSPKRGRTRGK